MVDARDRLELQERGLVDRASRLLADRGLETEQRDADSEAPPEAADVGGRSAHARTVERFGYGSPLGTIEATRRLRLQA